MITAGKVAVQFRHDGDGDHLARGGPTRDRNVPESGDWHTLNQLRIGLANVKAGTAFHDFARRTLNELQLLTESPETARMLMDMA